jgi:hypothetical protein
MTTRQFTTKDFEEAKRFFEMFDSERELIVFKRMNEAGDTWRQIIVFQNESGGGSYAMGDEPFIAKVFNDCLDRLKIDSSMQLRRHHFAYHTGMCMAFIHRSIPQLNAGLMLFYDTPTRLYPV